jgi:hypothetical protein
MRRIFCQESGQTQFSGDCPLWSSDNAKGAGIGQITPASDDEVWNWKINVASGKAKLASTRAIAAAFPGRIQNSQSLKTLLSAYNLTRTAAGLEPLKSVTVPAFTADQQEHDAIRGYNGYAGSDPDFPGFVLHEYRIVRDGNGLLQVTNINEATLTGAVSWEEVPVADRPQDRGEPNYVHLVLSRSPTCN